MFRVKPIDPDPTKDSNQGLKDFLKQWRGTPELHSKHIEYDPPRACTPCCWVLRLHFVMSTIVLVPTSHLPLQVGLHGRVRLA